MLIAIDRATLKSTLTKIDYLFAAHVFFMAVGIIGEWLVGEQGFFAMLFLGILSVLVYQSMSKVLKNLQYTFWSFAFVTGGISIFFTLTSESFLIVNCFFASGLFLLFLCLAVSTPLLYPLIMWWEYDFRFRGDLKIHAHLKDRCVDGRLTDLRREAGCVVLFEQLDLGEEFTIDYIHSGERTKYKVKAVTRRASSQGRGFTYGVQFQLNEKDEKLRYRNFSRLWKIKKRVKRELKFKKQTV